MVFELLCDARVRREERVLGLGRVPVILLGDVPVSEEVVRSRGLSVQGYARKPVDFAGLVSAVRSVAGVGFGVRR